MGSDVVVLHHGMWTDGMESWHEERLHNLYRVAVRDKEGCCYQDGSPYRDHQRATSISVVLSDTEVNQSFPWVSPDSLPTVIVYHSPPGLVSKHHSTPLTSTPLHLQLANFSPLPSQINLVL